MTYVIHGATGAQGAPVAAALAAAGKSVTALTRNASAVVPGARVVATDYSSLEQLTAAYRGAQGVFVHLPMASEEDRRRHAANVVAAVRETRPGRVIVSTSGDDSGLQDPAGNALGALVAGLEESGVSYAVVAPRLYMENLLLPPVLGTTRETGVLRYPLRPDFPVAWSSHLDVADVVAALFEQTGITGTVAIGQDPAVTGPQLAEAFAGRLGRPVAYEAMEPADFGTAIAPLFGEQAATGVAGFYGFLGTLPEFTVDADRSAQKLLGVSPRTPAQWLADIGL
ncbi:NAD(P)H azoreductase [Streptomyces sp. ADI96-02]|uniref:SDR family oxidoreductase n=1 Tax=unclassified Streptomyces TaxID=2593676 RepID=UPI000F5564B3|nr:NmrA family NAD(P)-binding protein [Streptomyces sp. ADI96-02]RPK58888.1 NAD(P)H azoreductase [Streptomyces sp. ADI96-02]